MLSTLSNIRSDVPKLAQLWCKAKKVHLVDSASDRFEDFLILFCKMYIFYYILFFCCKWF